jgi:hypothetical protein
MFQNLRVPSSGSTELCLTEITGSDLQIFCTLPNTDQAHHKISVNHYE